MDQNKSIQVEITDPSEFHCFRLRLNPRSAPGRSIEIMLHASALVDLIHQSSTALSAWQQQTTLYLLQQKTGMTEDELREKGLIA